MNTEPSHAHQKLSEGCAGLKLPCEKPCNLFKSVICRALGKLCVHMCVCVSAHSGRHASYECWRKRLIRLDACAYVYCTFCCAEPSSVSHHLRNFAQLALADTDLMPRGIVHRPNSRRLVGVRGLTHAHTHILTYTHVHTYTHTCTHTYTRKQRGTISWKPGCACTARVQFYSNTPILTPRLRGHECATALLPCACIPLPLATVPLGHHPRLVRIARNSPVPQKWYKRVTYLHLTCRCTVGGSWLRTPPAVLGSSELRSSELRSANRLLVGIGLLVGVRAPRRCLLGTPRMPPSHAHALFTSACH